MLLVEKDFRAAAQIVIDSKILPDYSLDEIEESVKDWEILTVVRQGKPIGMCMVKDKEIHFCILPEYRGKWLTKGLLKEISQLDFEYTTVPEDNLKSQAFVERMGFKPVQNIGEDIIYKLNSLTYGTA